MAALSKGACCCLAITFSEGNHVSCLNDTLRNSTSFGNLRATPQLGAFVRPEVTLHESDQLGDRRAELRWNAWLCSHLDAPLIIPLFRSIFNSLYFQSGRAALLFFPLHLARIRSTQRVVSWSLEIYLCIVLHVMTLHVTLVNLSFPWSSPWVGRCPPWTSAHPDSLRLGCCTLVFSWASQLIIRASSSCHIFSSLIFLGM